MNGYNLYRGALAQEKMHIEGAIVVNENMVFVPQQYDDHFVAVVVSRADFEGYGYDTSKISDDEMTHIASKIGERMVESDYWECVRDFGDEYMGERKNIFD